MEDRTPDSWASFKSWNDCDMGVSEEDRPTISRTRSEIEPWEGNDHVNYHIGRAGISNQVTAKSTHCLMRKVTENSQSKNWILTINNPTESDWAGLDRQMHLATYGCYAFERGPECQTLHIHALIMLNGRMRF